MAEFFPIRLFGKFSFAVWAWTHINFAVVVFPSGFVSGFVFEIVVAKFLLFSLTASPQTRSTSGAWKFSLVMRSKTHVSPSPLK